MSNEQELNEAINTYFERSGAIEPAESPRPAANCLYCGKRIKPTKTNKQRSYCNDSCKQAAYRARMRRRADPSIHETIVKAQIVMWKRRSFSDAMIQTLVPLWYAHGWDVIEAAEKLLILYQDIVVQHWAEKHTRDQDAAEAGAKRMEELYQARAKEAKEP